MTATSDGLSIGELLERCNFPPGPAVACGLSGGPDSTALCALAVEAGLGVTAWHVDHGIRPGSGDDVTIVTAIAERLGIDLELRRIDIEAGPDLEARARTGRYGVLPPDVCVGHTADDRAEAVLFNLGRGSGLAGVAATHRRVNRPILGLRRHETVALCDQLGLTVLEDPMNHDRTHARVAIRHDVLPALATALRRDPVPMLVRHADLAADALAVVEAAAAAIDPTDVAELAGAPRAVSAEALRRWIASETRSGLAPDAAAVDRVLEVVNGAAVATEICGGHRVARRAGRLRLEVNPVTAGRVSVEAAHALPTGTTADGCEDC